VRRDSLQIKGQGMIGLGRLPEQAAATTIDFTCEKYLKGGGRPRGFRPGAVRWTRAPRAGPPADGCEPARYSRSSATSLRHSPASTVSRAASASAPTLSPRVVEIRGPRQPADGRFARARLAAQRSSIQGEHPQVLAVPRPQELAVRVAPEPVDVVDARGSRELRADIEPVLPVIAEVVPQNVAWPSGRAS